jgi:uncharacterized membrane protein
MSENNSVALNKEKLWSILCYIPFFNLFFSVLSSVKFADKKDLRFHARQGVVLFAFSFFSLIFLLVSYKFGILFLLVLMLLHLVGIVAVFTDTFIIIPLIGQLAQKIPEFYLYTLLTGKEPSDLWD